MPKSYPFQPAPRIWPGETCVCIASGPSLTREDVEVVRGRAKVIVVNNTYQLAPWADVLWATDGRWWKWHRGAPDFPGRKFGMLFGAVAFPPDVHLLRNDGTTGLCLDPTGLRNGRNGGYAAVNLAVHLGVARILLLGYDMQRTHGKEHWHKDHPITIPNPYFQWRRHFATLVQPLKQAGVEVVNCTRETALECFPTMALEAALAPVEAVA